MDDPVFLITGASSGIGEATARRAASEGYRLVLGARRSERVERLTGELGGSDRALAVTVDVREWESQREMVEAALSHFGRIDVVFANAGIGGTPGGFSGADPVQWRDLVLTNVYGVALTVRASMEAIKESGGHLVLTGSAAGRFTIPGSMYSATKWAVTAMGDSIREEIRGSGARVTVVEPGVVDTPFFDDPKPGALQPEDVADAVLYAVSRPSHVDLNELLIRPRPPVE